MVTLNWQGEYWDMVITGTLLSDFSLYFFDIYTHSQCEVKENILSIFSILFFSTLFAMDGVETSPNWWYNAFNENN